MGKADDDRRALAVTQAAYYAITGIWPLVDIESFERLTGPKAERWLVRTVGALVTAIGASLAVSAQDDPGRPEMLILAAGSALALGTIDVVYVAKRRISPVYLLDALAQAALLIGWIRGEALEAAGLRE
jgi:hydrogenase/urease accessory protein HupE